MDARAKSTLTVCASLGKIQKNFDKLISKTGLVEEPVIVSQLGLILTASKVLAEQAGNFTMIAPPICHF